MTSWWTHSARPGGIALAVLIGLGAASPAVAGTVLDSEVGRLCAGAGAGGHAGDDLWRITGCPFAGASGGAERDAGRARVAGQGLDVGEPAQEAPLTADGVVPAASAQGAPLDGVSQDPYREPDWTERMRPYVRETLRTLRPLARGAPAWQDRHDGIVPWAVSVGSGLVDQPLQDIALLFLIDSVLTPNVGLDGGTTFSVMGIGRFTIETSADRSSFRLVETGTRTMWNLRGPDRFQPTGLTPTHPMARSPDIRRSSDAMPRHSILGLLRYIIVRTLESPWFYVSLLASGLFALAVKRWSRQVRGAADPGAAAGQRRPLPQ